MTESRRDLAVPPQIIVVGVDGSPESAKAVGWAAQVSLRLGAHLIAVHAMTLLDQVARVEDDPAVNLAGSWTEPARRVGVVPECLLEHGPPLLVLPRIVARVGADLLIAASHGVGGASGIVGSTCHGLLGAVEVPVVVVPRSLPGSRPESVPFRRA